MNFADVTACLPLTPCYLVVATPGSGGDTLITLLHEFLDKESQVQDYYYHLQDRIISDQIPTPEYNNWESEWDKRLRSVTDFNNGYSAYVNPLDDKETTYFVIGTRPDWREYFLRWPQGKAIVVTISKADKYDIKRTLWYTLLLELWNSPRRGTRVEDMWKDLQTQFPLIFAKYASPDLVTKEDIELYVQNHTKHSFKGSRNHSMDLFEESAVDIPQEYQDRILTMAYQDLVRGDTVLTRLSAFTGQPITESARQCLEEYRENLQAVGRGS